MTDYSEKFPRTKIRQIIREETKISDVLILNALCDRFRKIWPGDKRDGDERRTGITTRRYGTDGVMDTSTGRRKQTRRDNPDYVDPDGEELNIGRGN